MSFIWRLLFKKPPPWEWCCNRHDEQYAEGGDLELRQPTDIDLLCCVAKGEHSYDGQPHPYWAILMLLGVRIGGVFWLPFPSIKIVDMEHRFRFWRWEYSLNKVRWGFTKKYPRYK